MLPVGFEPKKSAGERPQTYALDRAATGTGDLCIAHSNYKGLLDSKIQTLLFNSGDSRFSPDTVREELL